MTRDRGTSIPDNHDTEAPAWEPEALELSLYLPVERRIPRPQADESQAPGSRVIIIDLA